MVTSPPCTKEQLGEIGRESLRLRLDPHLAKTFEEMSRIVDPAGNIVDKPETNESTYKARVWIKLKQGHLIDVEGTEAVVQDLFRILSG